MRAAKYWEEKSRHSLSGVRTDEFIDRVSFVWGNIVISCCFNPLNRVMTLPAYTAKIRLGRNPWLREKCKLWTLVEILRIYQRNRSKRPSDADHFAGLTDCSGFGKRVDWARVRVSKEDDFKDVLHLKKREKKLRECNITICACIMNSWIKYLLNT